MPELEGGPARLGLITQSSAGPEYSHCQWGDGDGMRRVSYHAAKHILYVFFLVDLATSLSEDRNSDSQQRVARTSDGPSHSRFFNPSSSSRPTSDIPRWEAESSLFIIRFSPRLLFFFFFIFTHRKALAHSTLNEQGAGRQIQGEWGEERGRTLSLRG